MRDALGIAMRGPGRLSQAVGTEFRAPLWELLGDRRYCVYAVTHPEAAGVFVPAGRGDRWVYGVEHDLARQSVASPTKEQATRLIRLGSGLTDLEPRIERIGTFTFAAQLADRWREGAVFLTAAAGHLRNRTPTGGRAQRGPLGRSARRNPARRAGIACGPRGPNPARLAAVPRPLRCPPSTCSDAG
ncbi:hypothetical protein CA951_11485 [Rhodococcus sp. NCIMB 12038]|nr:hypothetical protein CA951_11485 [Rhodococcus sp. NCIMB 12038]